MVHECFRHGSRHGSSFSDKTQPFVRVAVRIRETGSGPHTHVRANSEPSLTEGPGEPSRTRPSLARGAPHTDEFGSLEPEPSRTREPDPWRPTHRRVWLIGTQAEPDSWRPTHRRVWPIGTRAEPDSLARLVAPHTQTSLGHWNPSRAGLASQTHGAPHTDEFGSLEPEPSQTRGGPHTDEFGLLEPEPSQTRGAPHTDEFGPFEPEPCRTR
jgi:hypothetical protein